VTASTTEREALVEEFVDWAIENGVALVPTAKKGSKVPQGVGWQKTPAATERNRADLMKLAQRGRNLGVSAQGSPTIVVCEVDGAEDLAALEALDLGPAMRVVSGHESGDHLHLYWGRPDDWPDGAPHWGRLEKGSVTHNSGYFVGHGSVHPDSGLLYRGELCTPPTMKAGGAARFLAAITQSRRAEDAADERGERWTESTRHNGFKREAAKLAATHMGEEAIYEHLATLNETHCDPPKPRGRELEQELRGLARAAVTTWRDSQVDRMLAEAEATRKAPGRKDGGARAVGFKPLSEFAEEAVRFFDRPFLQANSFHVLAGRKGAGKGTYIADLCARISRGELGGKKNVLLISSEDSPGMDLRPRVAVAGGLIEHVYVVSEGWLQLPRDVELIREWADQIGDVAAIVIDPVGNHIAGKDSDAETAIRDAIGPLNGLADDLKAVVIGVRHLTEKDIRGGLISAILGSSAWVQVPRVVFGIVEDDKDPNLRHMKVGVGNRVPPGEDALSFRIEGVERDGHEVEITRLVWDGSTDKDLDELLRGAGNSKPRGTTRTAILDELEAAFPHGIESGAFDELVAARCGVTPKTVMNARVRLNEEGLIRAVPEKDEYGRVIKWSVLLAATPEVAS
jgi:hypothetical protein